MPEVRDGILETRLCCYMFLQGTNAMSPSYNSFFFFFQLRKSMLENFHDNFFGRNGKWHCVYEEIKRATNNV